MSSSASKDQAVERRSDLGAWSGLSQDRAPIGEDVAATGRCIEIFVQHDERPALHVTSGAKGDFAVATEALSAIVPNLGLPGRCSTEVLNAFRSNNITLPALMLFARDSVDERVLVLRRGADDREGDRRVR